jgi:hypothetical protein
MGKRNSCCVRKQAGLSKQTQLFIGFITPAKLFSAMSCTFSVHALRYLVPGPEKPKRNRVHYLTTVESVAQRQQEEN